MLSCVSTSVMSLIRLSTAHINLWNDYQGQWTDTPKKLISTFHNHTLVTMQHLECCSLSTGCNCCCQHWPRLSLQIHYCISGVHYCCWLRLKYLKMEELQRNLVERVLVLWAVLIKILPKRVCLVPYWVLSVEANLCLFKIVYTSCIFCFDLKRETRN